MPFILTIPQLKKKVSHYSLEQRTKIETWNIFNFQVNVQKCGILKIPKQKQKINRYKEYILKFFHIPVHKHDRCFYKFAHLSRSYCKLKNTPINLICCFIKKELILVKYICWHKRIHRHLKAEVLTDINTTVFMKNNC